MHYFPISNLLINQMGRGKSTGLEYCYTFKGRNESVRMVEQVIKFVSEVEKDSREIG